MNIGSALQRFRRQNKLSQQDIAAFLGVSQRTVSRWELGSETPTAEWESRLRLLIGDGGAMAAVWDAIRGAAVPLALVNEAGSVLVASDSYLKGMPQGPATADRSARTVLVIENHEAALRATRSVLKQWRMLSIGATSGGAALDMVRNSIRPDAAIIEFRLPDDMDGVDAAAALREVVPCLPIVLISGEVDAARMRKILDSGLPLITKPIDPLQIKLTLTALLESGEGPEQP